jgi:hypothetical protein
VRERGPIECNNKNRFLASAVVVVDHPRHTMLRINAQTFVLGIHKKSCIIGQGRRQGCGRALLLLAAKPCQKLSKTKKNLIYMKTFEK